MISAQELNQPRNHNRHHRYPLYLESYKVIPKRNYSGVYGQTDCRLKDRHKLESKADHHGAGNLSRAVLLEEFAGFLKFFVFNTADIAQAGSFGFILLILHSDWKFWLRIHTVPI